MSVTPRSARLRHLNPLRLRALLAHHVLADPDTWERHLIVAKLVDAPASLIDVGGLRGQLRSFLPDTNVTAVNVSEPADMVIPPGPLPFDDGAFDAATSLDALEHVPPEARRAFVAEVVRVARDRAVLCCPLGSAEHYLAEQATHAWYQSFTGHDNPWLAEHLHNGLPTLEDLRDITAPYAGQVRFLFHGDFREVNEQFKRVVAAWHRHRVTAAVSYARLRLAYRPRLELSDDPSPWTNRVFIVVTRS